MKDFSILLQNSLNYKLTPISIRELFFIESCPFDVYANNDGIYSRILKENREINNTMLAKLITQGNHQLYIKHEDIETLIEEHQEKLRLSVRSLSIGNPLENADQVLSLLSNNMGHLYRDPTNIETLSLQNQSIKNLFAFLEEHHSLHAKIYHSFMEKKYHYIFAQPMISSLFLVGILLKTKLFSQKERENLFVTSYFKDIGMSSIPTHKYDQIELSDKDKQLLQDHPKFSIEILSGKIQLPKSYFTIIENHHSFSLLGQLDITDIAGQGKSSDILISGFETMIITVLDIVSAMITERPYRPDTSLFHALDLIRILIADEYPQEFKLLVNHFKNFF